VGVCQTHTQTHTRTHARTHAHTVCALQAGHISKPVHDWHLKLLGKKYAAVAIPYVAPAARAQDTAHGLASESASHPALTPPATTAVPADVQSTQPAVVALEPERVVVALEPEPAIDALEPEPAIDAREPQPAVDALEPEPAVDALEPEPAVDAREPQPAVESVISEPSVAPALAMPEASATPPPAPAAVATTGVKHAAADGDGKRQPLSKRPASAVSTPRASPTAAKRHASSAASAMREGSAIAAFRKRKHGNLFRRSPSRLSR
jgi:hypothetical protein